ncbi:MAG: hypothetical protein QW158_02855 [Nitrososphaerales archaeon]
MVKSKHFLLLITLVFILASAHNIYAAKTPQQALIDYYEACKAGDVKAYMNTVDLDYIEQNIADLEEYTYFVEAALIEYPMTTYKLHNLTVREIPEEKIAVAFFDVEAEVVPKETGQPLGISREMAALLTFSKGEWKVAFVIDRKLFWTHQQEAMTLLALNQTSYIIEEQAQRIESVQAVPVEEKTTQTATLTQIQTTTQQPEIKLPELPTSMPDLGWLDLKLLLPIIIIIIIIAGVARKRKR